MGGGVAAQSQDGQVALASWLSRAGARVCGRGWGTGASCGPPAGGMTLWPSVPLPEEWEGLDALPQEAEKSVSGSGTLLSAFPSSPCGPECPLVSPALGKL